MSFLARLLARARVTRPREVSKSIQRRLLPEPLSKALIEARQKASLTQRQLAARAQVDPSTVAYLETGWRSPGRETLNRLKVVLGLSEELCQEIIRASRVQKPISEQVARLAALPFRWYEMADLKQRSLRDRAKGKRSQKGGQFIRNQRFALKPRRRGGR